MTELQNAKLLEDHMKSEIAMHKQKREESEGVIKELKISKGKDQVIIRQLKAEMEIKKREVIDGKDIINRAVMEMEEAKKEAKEIRDFFDACDRERTEMLVKIKKLEREVVRGDAERRRLEMVVEMQARRLGLEESGEESILEGRKNWRSKQSLNKEMKMRVVNSFDSVLTPIERSQYEQNTPFSSSKGLNKTVVPWQINLVEINEK